MDYNYKIFCLHDNSIDASTLNFHQKIGSWNPEATFYYINIDDTKNKNFLPLLTSVNYKTFPVLFTCINRVGTTEYKILDYQELPIDWNRQKKSMQNMWDYTAFDDVPTTIAFPSQLPKTPTSNNGNTGGSNKYGLGLFNFNLTGIALLILSLIIIKKTR